MGDDAEEPGGTTVTPGVELVAEAPLDDGAGDDELRVVSRVPDDEDDVPVQEDELEAEVLDESFGGDLSQFALPLEATFGGS